MLPEAAGVGVMGRDLPHPTPRSAWTSQLWSSPWSPFTGVSRASLPVVAGALSRAECVCVHARMYVSICVHVSTGGQEPAGCVCIPVCVFTCAFYAVCACMCMLLVHVCLCMHIYEPVVCGCVGGAVRPRLGPLMQEGGPSGRSRSSSLLLQAVPPGDWV